MRESETLVNMSVCVMKERERDRGREKQECDTESAGVFCTLLHSYLIDWV